MIGRICNTISSYPNASGGMPLLYAVRDCVPMAWDGLLLVIFLLLFGAQYYLIKNRTGRAKVFVALMSSSFFMVILSMLLALTQLVTFISVLFYSFICIVSFILLVISDNT